MSSIKRVGIDLSLNFTAMVISENEVAMEWIGISNSANTKFLKAISKANSEHSYPNIILHRTTVKSTEKDYQSKEIYKTEKLCEIISIIDCRLSVGDINECVIEGLAFGSNATNSLCELSALNYMVRQICKKYNIKYIIASPTSLKKFVTGNGACDKDLMIKSLCSIYPEWKLLESVLKIDDFADAYFLSQFII